MVLNPGSSSHTALRPAILNRKLRRARAMEEQSGREFASTNSTTGAYDATIQEPWLGPQIPLNPCRRFQYLQRPTPSDFSPNAPHASRRGDGHAPRSSRCRLNSRYRTASRRRFDNVTAPAGSLSRWRPRQCRTPRPCSPATAGSTARPSGERDQPRFLLAVENPRHEGRVSAFRLKPASSPSSTSCLRTRQVLARIGMRTPLRMTLRQSHSECFAKTLERARASASLQRHPQIAHAG